MGKVLQAELVIKGSDKTGAAFAGVIKHAEELRRAMGGMKGMSLNDPKLKEASRELRMQSRLVRDQNAAWRAVNDTIALGNREMAARAGLINRITAGAHRFAHFSGMGWMIGGMASGAVTRNIAHDAAEFAHQRANLTIGGMNAADVQESIARAYELRVPGMAAADNLRAIGELRTVFGSTEEALHNVASVQRAAAALRAINPQVNGEAESYNLARSLELKGVSNDPAHFNRLANMMVQAINATHGKVDASEFLSFTKYAGSATARTLSDDFYTRVAPTLIQEMHGNSAGRAMATLRRQLVGGHMQLQSAGEWMRLGLLDRNKVEFDKIGHVKRVHPGALVDSESFVTNPYEWIHRHLAPALKKKGITDEKKVAVELANLFSDRYAENMATILLTQKKRIEKDSALISGAADSSSVDYSRTHDPLAAARDLSSAAETMLSAFGGPLAKPAITAMNSLSDWVREAAGWYGHFQEKHPLRSMAASGVGAAGLGFVAFQGFRALWGLGTAGPALNASAAALDGSAAALNAAAARLGGTSVTDTAARTGIGAWLASRAGVLFGTTLGAAGFYFGSTEEAGSGEADIYRRNPTTGSMELTPYGRSLMAPNAGPAGVPLAAPPVDISAAKPPKAELSGQADVKVNVEVKTEPGFWASVRSSVSSAIDHLRFSSGPSTGSTGSTGHTMPEASSHP